MSFWKFLGAYSIFECLLGLRAKRRDAPPTHSGGNIHIERQHTDYDAINRRIDELESRMAELDYDDYRYDELEDEVDMLYDDLDALDEDYDTDDY